MITHKYANGERGAVSWTIRPATCARRCHAEFRMPAMLSVHIAGVRTAFQRDSVEYDIVHVFLSCF